MAIKVTEGLKKFIERFASREVLATRQSDINPVLEVVRVGEIIKLNTANTNYSFGGLHRVFQQAFKRLKLDERKIDSLLILGFGTGSVASILRNEMKLNPMIKAVELDPVVVQLGREYFNTDSYKNLEIIEAEAAAYVSKEKEKYDLIVVDVYVDFEVPESCETAAFISDICKCLLPGGMVVFNKLIYNHKSREEARDLETKFRRMKGITRVLKIREGMMNKMIVFESNK